MMGAWLGAERALLLAVPFLVLSATIWLMRLKWVVWLALVALILIEAGTVAAYVASDAPTRTVLVTAFAIAASAVQVPIGVLVAAARYFQNAE